MDFNQEAVNWDNDRRVQRAKIIANEIYKAIPEKKSLHAMEFGCGTGLISFNLKDRFEQITLIDTSEGMIEILKQKIQEQKAGNMNAIQADINSNALQLGKFDVIYTSMALHHVVDTEKTLRNLYNLLQENGCLCIVELDEEDGSFHKEEKDFDGHNGFNQKDLKQLLEKVGYMDVCSRSFYKDYKTIENAKVDYSLFLMEAKKR